MRSRLGTLGVAFVLAGGAAVAAVSAQEKALPTLLIKGEVVSVDSSDPAASLLKVKDRYGFETPIFITPETKILQGDASAAASSLAAGTPVEVEYNFDVNTAKRHAVSVKIATAGPAAAPAAAPATPAPAALEPAIAAPAPSAPAAESAAPAATPSASAPATSAAPATGNKAPSTTQ